MSQARRQYEAKVQALQKAEAEIERLRKDVHNLNWALGTDGYSQMATTEEQAEHEAGMARTEEFIERLKTSKSKHDEMVKDAERYRWLKSTPAQISDGPDLARWEDCSGFPLRGDEADEAIDKAMEAK